MTLYVCIGENSESGKEKIIIIQLSDPNLKDFSFFFVHGPLGRTRTKCVFFVYHRFYRPFLEYTTLLFYDSEFGIGIAG